MRIEQYKQLIIELIEKSEDIDYIIAVYSFADTYPDRSQDQEEKDTNP